MQDGKFMTLPQRMEIAQLPPAMIEIEPGTYVDARRVCSVQAREKDVVVIWRRPPVRDEGAEEIASSFTVETPSAEEAKSQSCAICQRVREANLPPGTFVTSSPLQANVSRSPGVKEGPAIPQAGSTSKMTPAEIFSDAHGPEITARMSALTALEWTFDEHVDDNRAPWPLKRFRARKFLGGDNACHAIIGTITQCLDFAEKFERTGEGMLHLPGQEYYRAPIEIRTAEDLDALPHPNAYVAAVGDELASQLSAKLIANLSGELLSARKAALEQSGWQFIEHPHNPDQWKVGKMTNGIRQGFGGTLSECIDRVEQMHLRHLDGRLHLRSDHTVPSVNRP